MANTPYIPIESIKAVAWQYAVMAGCEEPWGHYVVEAETFLRCFYVATDLPRHIGPPPSEYPEQFRPPPAPLTKAPEMVERVAREIHRYTIERANVGVWGVIDTFATPDNKCLFSSPDRFACEQWLRIKKGRAAIEAMREATAAMEEVASEHLEEFGGDYKDAYRYMIDAALKE